MLAYAATKTQFLRDAPVIEDKVRDAVYANLHIHVGPAEYQSWKNSLGNAMSHVMHDARIPGDAAVAIEYRVNGRKFRIDFLIAGKDEEDRESLVIVELKQWSDVDFHELPEHVQTFVGGTVRATRHPSYQAWSYASHLQQFNEFIYTNDVRVSACAYLHNCNSSVVVRDGRYAEELAKAPVFIKGEISGVQEIISSRIKSGTGVNLLHDIDSSPVRPSRQLAQAVGSMLKGNEEFVLLDDQKTVLETILSAATKAQVDSKQVVIVKGGPGTGKSVIAINALSRATSIRMNARYVTPNAAPRTVFEDKLQGTLPGASIRDLFSGSASFTKTAIDSYDLLIVDEAHRLKLRSQYIKGVNQIKEIIESSRSTVFFIDEAQKVTWQDIGEVASIQQFARAAGAEIQILELTSQFRCSGSDDYIVWLDNALGVHVDNETYFSPERFDFRICDSPTEMQELIYERNKADNKARLVAGYCWDWVSKKSRGTPDIVFPAYGFEAEWNLSDHGGAWIIHPESVEQVGCIHTCQGLELDYVGVIIGPDLVYESGHLTTNPSARARTDKSMHGYKKEFKENPVLASTKADELIRNTYRTLMSRGMKGCYVYFTDKAASDYFKELLPD